jgi:salicylate hydroxylase
MRLTKSYEGMTLVGMTDFDVMIIGAGIGGLALAHGLRRAGIPVHVYERTRERTDWLQGYRIHINPVGARALRDCLPPAGWQAFLETVSTGDGGFAFLTDRGAELLSFTDAEINAPSADPADRHYGVSRIRLREVLLGELDDIVRLGKNFTGYEPSGDRVIAHFDDGTIAIADILVGADGANSRVRGQLLPDARRADTGVVAVAGKCPLTPDRAVELPPTLTSRANIIIPRGRGSLFTAVWQHDRPAMAATPPAQAAGEADRRPDAPSASALSGYGDTTDYAIWGFSDAARQFPPEVETMTGEALQQVVTDRLAGWSPDFHRLVRGSDPATVNAFRVKSADPVAAWPTCRVTLLGDAIHNMTPMAGIGANTALRDADLLRRRLIAARSGEVSVIPAISGYERQMLDYGFAAVRRSLRNARRAATSTWFSRAALRTVLRVTATIPPMRRSMARSLGR